MKQKPAEKPSREPEVLLFEVPFGRDQLRVTFSIYKRVPRIQIRKWYWSPEGLKPGKIGIGLLEEHLVPVRKALRKSEKYFAKHERRRKRK